MFALHQKFIVNEKGNRTAIVLPYPEWEKILEVLEEFDDICAYDKAKIQPSDPVPLEQVLKQLKDMD